MNKIAYFTTGLVLASALLAIGQPPPPSGPPTARESPGSFQSDAPRADALLRDLFPPELVMRHQKALQLTAEQQAAIKSEMQKSLSRFTELQWQQAAAEEALQELLRQDRLNETEILAQFDQLLAAENQIKKLRLATLIRVKNVLSAEQQAALRKLRPRPPVGGMPAKGPLRIEPPTPPAD